MRRVLMSPTTKGKTMKFQSKDGTWVIFNQDVLILIADDYEFTHNLDGKDLLDLTQFLENIEAYGAEDIHVKNMFGVYEMTYIADEDVIKITESPAIGHAWFVDPENLWRVLDAAKTIIAE